MGAPEIIELLSSPVAAQEPPQSEIIDLLSSPVAPSPVQKRPVPPSTPPEQEFNFDFGLDTSPSKLSPVRKRAKAPPKAPKDPKAPKAPKAAQAAKANDSDSQPSQPSSGFAAKPKASKPARAARTKSTAVKLSKITRDRNDTIKELVVSIDGSVHDLPAKLEEIGVMAKVAELGQTIKGLNAVLSLTRTTSSHWDATLRAYVEGDLHTEAEPLKIIVLDAELCVQLMEDNLLLEQLDSRYGRECVYVIEGYGKLLKKQVAAYGRMIAQRTRNALNNNNTLAVADVAPPDAAGFMRKQVSLQLVHSRRTVYCEKQVDAVEWIIDLLKDYSIKRYSNKAFVNFNTSTVKSQKELPDIKVEALVQLPRVSKRSAEALSGHFKSLGDMVANSRGMSLPLSANLRTMLDRFVDSTDPDEII